MQKNLPHAGDEFISLQLIFCQVDPCQNSIHILSRFLLKLLQHPYTTPQEPNLPPLVISTASFPPNHSASSFQTAFRQRDEAFYSISSPINIDIKYSYNQCTNITTGMFILFNFSMIQSFISTNCPPFTPPRFRCNFCSLSPYNFAAFLRSLDQGRRQWPLSPI